MPSQREFTRLEKGPNEKNSSDRAESSHSARRRHVSTWGTSLDTCEHQQVSNDDKGRQIDKITVDSLARREEPSRQQHQWQFETLPLLEVPKPSHITKLKDNLKHFQGRHRHERVNEQIESLNENLRQITEKLNNNFLPQKLHKQFKKV